MANWQLRLLFTARVRLMHERLRCWVASQHRFEMSTPGAHSGLRNHLGSVRGAHLFAKLCKLFSQRPARRPHRRRTWPKELKAPGNARWNTLGRRFRLKHLTKCHGVFDTRVRVDRSRLTAFGRRLRQGLMWNCFFFVRML